MYLTTTELLYIMKISIKKNIELSEALNEYLNEVQEIEMVK